MGGHGRTRAGGLAVMAAAAVTAASLTACGGSGGSGPSGFSALLTTENTNTPAVLEALSKNECKAQNDALPLTIETVPQTQIDQKVQLLAGQGALPVLYGAGTPAIIKALAANGQVVDLEKSLADSGAISNVLPGALSTIKNLYGGFYVLPLQYNIEGIWYNKRIFADHGIEAPATWDQLVSAAQKLSAAGVQPFSASGQQKWPLTRFISGYIYRKLGPNAFDAVYDGSARFTDPDYVAAAAAVADLGSNGWFGKGVGSIDYDTATNTFLTGKAAMFYMGSWALANFADPEQDKIGADNIGFMPFPAVTGGAGSADQYPANVGLPIGVSSKGSSKEAGAWLDCIAKNYGNVALTEKKLITGFRVDVDVEVNAKTKMVQDVIASAKTTILWMEAQMTPRATAASTSNVGLLVTGQLSPQDYMRKIQSAVDWKQ